jgi:hypothetical protein
VKIRLAFLFLLVCVVSAFAVTPAQAQNNYNCAYWGWRTIADDQTIDPFGPHIASETVTWKAYGIDGNSGQITCTPQPVAVTATGQAGHETNCFNCGVIVCNPRFSIAFLIPDYINTIQLSWSGIGRDNEFAAPNSCLQLDSMTEHIKTVFCPTRKCNGGKCPVILDTSGQGFLLTDTDHGVKFDFYGNGSPIQMAWTAPGAANGFLALPAMDGLVHNSTQLFGNFTPQPPSDHRNGFAALAVFDDPANGGNGDGVIDSKDAVFNSLRIWIDANHDGVSQPEELHTLPSLGINSIGLKYQQSDKVDQFGNAFKYWAPVNPDNPNGSTVGKRAVDVFFVSQ